IALEQWLPRHETGKMQLLSLPCSTGEEAFSIVMTLLDAGLPPDRFRVDAIDVSNQALAFARKGLYSKNAFRGKDLSFRERHFRYAGEDFLLNESIKRQVQFAQQNMLGSEFLAYQARYDVIFFRNLLIYFDRESQEHALQQIDKMLEVGGVLFVGAAEQPIFL